MDNQHTERMGNLANTSVYEVERLLLQGYYFDENSKAEAVVSSSEMASAEGGKWLLDANWQGPELNSNECRLELGSAGEEIFYKSNVHTLVSAAAHVLPPNELGGNIGMNMAEGNMSIQDYLGLVNTQSSKSSNFFNSGHAASVWNHETTRHMSLLGGGQWSAGAQRSDNLGCSNPNLPFGAVHEYWETGYNKAYLDATTNHAQGCSSNPQHALTLPITYDRSLDIRSSNYRVEGVSLNQPNSTSVPTGQQMCGMSSKYCSPDDYPYSFSVAEYSGAGMLRSSKYLRAAQQLLEETCSVKLQTSYDHRQYITMKRAPHSRTAVSEGPTLHSERSSEDPLRCKKPRESMYRGGLDRLHWQTRKAQLVGMVEALDRSYQQYHEHMQLILTSFESAAGMNAAAPYTSLARKLISRQFRSLRDAIGEHIHDVCRMLGEDISTVPVLNKGETPRLRILDQRLRHRQTLQQVSVLPQVWRPQRGLPERCVAVLRAWLFEHFLHPYPKESEKLMLARLTGLTRNQVANWFINARVRLWKPMVEQMYIEEKKEAEPRKQAAALEQQCDRITFAGHGSAGCHFKGNNVAALAVRENAPKRHVHEEEHSGALQSSIMTKHGISLTLALHESSSDEQLVPNAYKSNPRYLLEHPVSGEGDFNISTGVLT